MIDAIARLKELQQKLPIFISKNVALQLSDALTPKQSWQLLQETLSRINSTVNRNAKQIKSYINNKTVNQTSQPETKKDELAFQAQLDNAFCGLYTHYNHCLTIAKARDIYSDLQAHFHDDTDRYLDAVKNVTNNEVAAKALLKFMAEVVNKEAQYLLMADLIPRPASLDPTVPYEINLYAYQMSTLVSQTILDGFNKEPFKSLMKLDDPYLQHYHYPQILNVSAMLLFIYIDFSNSYANNQIPYNILLLVIHYASIEIDAATSSSLLRCAQKELLQFFLYVGVQSALSSAATWPSFVYSALNYSVIRGAQFLAGFIPNRYTIKSTGLYQYGLQQLTYSGIGYIFKNQVPIETVTDFLDTLDAPAVVKKFF